MKRLGRAEPFFSIYYDGRQASCCGLSQWGSEELGRQGLTPIQILRHYYPNDIDIYESTNFADRRESFPGFNLREGMSGEAVRSAQIFLNRISGDFWMPNAGRPDGVFGPATRAATAAFQNIFNLVPDGIIGRNTWYTLIRIYVAVKKLAELDSEGKRIGIGAVPPASVISSGARGEDVVKLQFVLNYISQFYEDIPFIPEDGVFGDSTREAVIAFQSRFNLTADGVVGPNTWRRLYEVYHDAYGTVVHPPESDTPAFPGTNLTIGSNNNDVRTMQRMLAELSRHYAGIPEISADGVFGNRTAEAVRAFQNEFGLPVSGTIDRNTWYRIAEEYDRVRGAAPGPGPTPVHPYPGTALRNGSSGENVRLMQSFLNDIGRIFPVIPQLNADGRFGPLTQQAVMAFQRLFGLTADGVIGPTTWNAIVRTRNNLPEVNSPAFPGTALRQGSSGDNVRLIQRYLNVISTAHPDIARLNEDGADVIIGLYPQTLENRELGGLAQTMPTSDNRLD